MKLRSYFLAASLLANAVLLVLLLRSPKEKNSRPAITPSNSGHAQSVIRVDPTDDTLPAADSAALARTRDLIAIDDLPTLISRLRSAGFDAMDIRAIVSARLNKVYGARRKAAVADLEVVPYWQSNSSFPFDPLIGAEVRGLFNEQTATMRRLLGPDFNSSDEWSAMLREREFGYLPSNKVDRLNTIVDDYKDLRSAIFTEGRGVMLPEDQAKLKLIEQEQRADIEALFTSEELEAYDLHTSNTARQLRSQMRAFKPTEEEYLAIYRIAQAAGSEFNPASFLNRGPPTEIQRQIQAVLSPDRAAAFLIKTDPAYIQIDRIAPRLQLSDTTVTQVYTATQDMQKRTQALLTNRSLPAETKASQLRAIALEAEHRLTGLLGPTGFEVYRSQAGQWLQNLQTQANQLAPTGN